MITALLGAVQGIVIGILLGYAVSLALRDEGLRPLHPAGLAIVVILVLAVVVGCWRPDRTRSPGGETGGPASDRDHVIGSATDGRQRRSW